MTCTVRLLVEVFVSVNRFSVQLWLMLLPRFYRKILMTWTSLPTKIFLNFLFFCYSLSFGYSPSTTAWNALSMFFFCKKAFDAIFKGTHFTKVSRLFRWWNISILQKKKNFYLLSTVLFFHFLAYVLVGGDSRVFGWIFYLFLRRGGGWFEFVCQRVIQSKLFRFVEWKGYHWRIEFINMRGFHGNVGFVRRTIENCKELQQEQKKNGPAWIKSS